MVDGEKCMSDLDCASGTCKGGVCLGSEWTCTDTSQCITGKYCDKNICKSQKSQGASCLSDEECINQAGCLSGKCTIYWSLTNLTDIPQSDLAETYCASGFSWKGQCATLVSQDNMPYQCNGSCNYTIAETNVKMAIPNFCSCGYNSDGLKYCQQGSNSIAFSKYVETSMRILDQGCHVSKKYNCTNQINYIDTLSRQNYYLSWKGKFQLSSDCLVSFFSGSFYLRLDFVSFLFLFLLSIIFL